MLWCLSAQSCAGGDILLLSIRELLLSNLCLEAVEPSPFRNGVCFHSLWVLSPSVIIGYFQDAKMTFKVFKISYFSADETGRKFGRPKYIALFCDWGGKKLLSVAM